jgi:ribonuclease R
MKNKRTRFNRHQERARGNRPQKEKESAQRIVGVLTKVPNGWRLKSTNRRERGEFILHAKTRFDLKEGDLAVAEILPRDRHRRFAREAKLIETLGGFDAPRAVSLIAIATHEIPERFTKEALDEAHAARPVTVEGRVDLREIPLVTIDGEDARDFDDAVFAEREGEGWHLIVAIADVAHYVKPGSALDKCAYERGNSAYFPDRVVPMLPEALSNELCSLKPHVDRAALAVHLWIDRLGELTRWQFVRAVIKSQARLTYTQVQGAKDGAPDESTKPLLDKVIRPLYDAFQCLTAARFKRGTLELDLPERKVEIVHGEVKAIKTRERLDAHRLIEEFMITANVAAAAQLEQKGGVCLYRVHDKPTEIKLEALRDFLESLEINLVPSKQMHSRVLTKIIEDHATGPHNQVVNEMILRTQAQAIYSPINIGHFGLALAKYAHFTSPIRRYADLVVHRGLIRAGRLGEDGLTADEIARLEKIGDHISMTERRAAAAERDVVDRFTTLYLAGRLGEVFEGRISGVARFGLFARLDETGADGIIPISSLPEDYYHFDEKRQAYIGKRSKRVYQLAQPVTVRLEEADKITGSMRFSIVTPGSRDTPSPAPKPTKYRHKEKRPFRGKRR